MSFGFSFASFFYLFFFFFFLMIRRPPRSTPLSLHDALPISYEPRDRVRQPTVELVGRLGCPPRSEEHTSELQSHSDLVCRLLLEKKKKKSKSNIKQKKKKNINTTN